MSVRDRKMKRCVAESNRLGWFCRPETKPFIQRTK